MEVDGEVAGGVLGARGAGDDDGDTRDREGVREASRDIGHWQPGIVSIYEGGYEGAMG